MKSRSPVTTHILDTAHGKAAPGIKVELEFLEGTSWKTLSSKSTNSDGRIEDLLDPSHKLQSGTYRLNFHTGSYFKNQGFYPLVTVTFQVPNAGEHFHVPLLISPFGYSTYRGT